MIKKLIGIITFLVICVFSFGNDWAFESRGEHLIPLEISNIAIKKEKIELKFEENKASMNISVNFVFDSPSEGKKTIGFITPPDEYNDADSPGGEYNPDNIKNFKTMVNGKAVKISIGKASEFLNKGFFTKEEEKEYKEKYGKAYVYYFTADLKKGENIINHSYSYNGASSTTDKGEYQYVLTTISKWKNKKVDDFEITVSMPKNIVFSLPYSFWNNGKRVNWELIGEGDIIFLDKSKLKEGYSEIVYAKLKNGYIRYKTQNFSPDEEFISEIPNNSFQFPNVKSDIKINGYKFNDSLEEEIGSCLDETATQSYCKEPIKKLDRLSTFQLEIMRNYPFAKYGYNFSRKDLKDYFKQFFWYEPKDNVFVPEYEYKNRVKILDSILKKRKNK